MTNAGNSYNEMMKIWSDYNIPQIDYNNIFSTQRRNLEAVSEANQVVVDSLQEINRRHSEFARSNIEAMLHASKDLVSGGTPELSATKQAELAKSLFDSSLATLRESSEMITKSGLEAFEVLNKRATQSIEEINAAA